MATKLEIEEEFGDYARQGAEIAKRRKWIYLFEENEDQLLGFTKNGISTILNPYSHLSFWYVFELNGKKYQFDVRALDGFDLTTYMYLVENHTHIKLINFLLKYLESHTIESILKDYPHEIS